jgi:hypothetical protein
LKTTPKSKKIVLVVLLIISIPTVGFIVAYKKSESIASIYSSATFPYNDLRINSFMLTKKRKITLWLGEKYQNRLLAEPINIIMVDKISTTQKDSLNNLESACAIINYKKKKGHSSEYLGKINEHFLSQFPSDYRMAFSDNDYWKLNNHGRFFGPYQNGHNSWIYIGQFSRENFKAIAFIHHKYISYDEARDNFSSKMNKMTSYRIVETIKANNVIETSYITTGDHDGNIIVLELREEN